MRLHMEQKLVSQNQRIPNLKSTYLGLEILRGEDEDIDFEDFLCGKNKITSIFLITNTTSSTSKFKHNFNLHNIIPLHHFKPVNLQFWFFIEQIHLMSLQSKFLIFIDIWKTNIASKRLK